MSQAPNTDELTITVTCCNCYNEKEVSVSRIGADIHQFYKEHRTRIGRTFCSLDAIVVRYNIIHQHNNQLRTKLLDAVEAEYQKMHTIGRVMDDGRRHLFVDCSYRDNVKQAISAVFENEQTKPKEDDI